ncbi:Uncharacterized protein APZ42_034096 [Daphnia magna]|uniref:Uncharacterized protein n=1 Tax=Daphnia magna TaxID=35525 RepID=A0A164KFH4_9CRUS|nr:Uncharacterized protein APZ42_034096 [Daphnia magna]
MLRLEVIASITVLVTFSFLPCICARLCQRESQGLSNNATASQSYSDNQDLYHCPQPGDPSHFTDCCYSDSKISGECCERKHRDFVSGFDDSLLIAISVGVIIVCLLTSVLVLICCFCSRCPLYTVCHNKYHHNDTIAFTTKEELMKLNGMPNEDYKIQHGYEPNAVQVRPVHYDA